MFNFRTKDYYVQIAQKLEDEQLVEVFNEFHKEHKTLPPEEYVQKLDERFGGILINLDRINKSKRLKSMDISLMWVRVMLIISLSLGILSLLFLIP